MATSKPEDDKTKRPDPQQQERERREREQHERREREQRDREQQEREQRERPEHPHGGPPGQTGDHPQGGPPGQQKPEPKSGPLGGGPTGQQSKRGDLSPDEIHSTLVPSTPPDPEKLWQNYAVRAINKLYPHMRNGVDFAYGRKTPDADPELTDWNEERGAKPDMGKIEEAARKLAVQSPRGPGRSLAGQPAWGHGEVPPYREGQRLLPEGVAQSEANPQLQTGDKYPSQPATEAPVPPRPDLNVEKPAEPTT